MSTCAIYEEILIPLVLNLQLFYNKFFKIKSIDMHIFQNFV